MLDNELFIAIRLELLARLAEYNVHDLTDVKVKRSFQPTQQATSNDRVIFIHRVDNPQPGGGIVYNGTTRIEQKFKRASFQFDCLAPFNPADTSALLPGDILTIAADLIQSYKGIRNLRAKGVKIERVTDVRPSRFVNDQEQFEMSPSFDLTVNYQHDYETDIPEVTRVDEKLYGV